MAKNRTIVEKFIRSAGRGGQHVNKVATSVYLKHLPTGIEVKYGRERSQRANRKEAYRIILEKLAKRQSGIKEQKKSDREKKRRQNRKRPKWLKEKILEGKRIHSEKKKYRRGIKA